MMMIRKSQQSPGSTSYHHLIGVSTPPPPPSSSGDHTHITPLSVSIDGRDGGGRPNGISSNGGDLDVPAGSLLPRNVILPPLDKPRESDSTGYFYRHMGHNDEDDHRLGPLPYKWEKAYTEGGETYFIDHNTGTSHWLDPRLSKYQKKSLEDCRDDELPYGWEKINDPQYGTYFIDHVNRRTQYENPVLEAKRRLERQSTGSGTPMNSTFERGVGRNEIRDDSLIVDGGSGVDDEAGTCKTTNKHFTRNPAELCGGRLTTTLLKSSRGLGFTIVGGDDNVDEFLQIKSIVPNGPAWLDGKLITGDVLVYVNDTCVLGFNHHEMVNVFQSIMPGETVTLEVCRGYPLPFDPNDPNTEVVTTIAVDGIGGPATKNSEKVSLMMDLNTENNYDFLNMVVRDDKDDELPSQGRKFMPPYIGNASYFQRNGGVFFDDNLKALCQQSSSLEMDRAHAEILIIQIVKGTMGFGFTIADSATGQRVKKILDRTCSKTLQEGDILLAINAISVTGLTHTAVVQVLKDCPIGQEAVVKIRRVGTTSGTNGSMEQSYQMQGSNKGLHLNSIGLLNGGPSGIGGGLKKVFSKDVNRFRSKTPTADLYSTQQKEVLPIRPKTPLVDTRVHSKTPTNELMNIRSMDVINNNATGGSSCSAGSKGSQKRLTNKSEDDDEDVDELKQAVNDDELDLVLKELEVMESKSDNNTNDPGGALSSEHGHQDAKSTASYPDHDSINNDLMSYSMDSYPKMMGQLADRLAEATITRPGTVTSTYLTDNPSTYHHHGNSQQAPHFMGMRNDGGGIGMDSVNSLNMSGQNRMPSNMYQHKQQQPMNSSQSDLTYDVQLGRGTESQTNGPSFGNNSIYANVLSGDGRLSVTNGRMGTRIPNDGGPNNGLYSVPSIPIMPPIPTYHQDSCYCFECEEYHRQQQEYNLHMQNQIQLQTLMQNRAASAMSNPYARKEFAIDNRRAMLWTTKSIGGSDTGMDESPGEFSLSEVTLERQSLGFGFRIVGGTEEGSQVTVGHIVPGGAADLDPRISTGDEILSIDGINVVGASHHRVVQLMGEAGARGRVTMILRRRMMMTNGNGPDLGWSNQTVVPLLSQVANSQNFRFPYDVIVNRNENEGFGFVIISSTNQFYGATIGKLIPGSPADRCTELKVGDRIIAVNRMDIAGMNHGEIVNLIKESGLHVRLTIGPPQQAPQTLNKNDHYFDKYPQQL